MKHILCFLSEWKYISDEEQITCILTQNGIAIPADFKPFNVYISLVDGGGLRTFFGPYAHATIFWLYALWDKHAVILMI